MQVCQALRGAFAAAIAMVFFTVSAEGGNWYVDAGKPAGIGDGKTPETAFHAIQDAVTNVSVQAGDTIHVAEGDYNEGWNKTKMHSYNCFLSYNKLEVNGAARVKNGTIDIGALLIVRRPDWSNLCHFKGRIRNLKIDHRL